MKTEILQSSDYCLIFRYHVHQNLLRFTRLMTSHQANLSKSALVFSDIQLKDNLKVAKKLHTAISVTKPPSGLWSEWKGLLMFLSLLGCLSLGGEEAQGMSDDKF